MDVFDGNPFSAHEPGLFDGFGECGIYDPAMENVSGSIAALADLDRLTHEPTRRCARHGPVGGEHVLESALDVVAEILEEFAVGKVNDGLIKAAEIVIGNVILDGVHGEAAHTQQGAVVLGIIDVAEKRLYFQKMTPLSRQPGSSKWRIMARKRFLPMTEEPGRASSA